MDGRKRSGKRRGKLPLTAETSTGRSERRSRTKRSRGGGCPGAVLITTASLNTEIVEHVSTLHTYNTRTDDVTRGPSVASGASRRAVASPPPPHPTTHHPAPPRRAVLPSTFHSQHPLLFSRLPLPRSSQSRAATYRLSTHART